MSDVCSGLAFMVARGLIIIIVTVKISTVEEGNHSPSLVFVEAFKLLTQGDVGALDLALGGVGLDSLDWDLVELADE